MRLDSEQTAAESSDDQPAVTAATDPDVDSKTGAAELNVLRT